MDLCIAQDSKRSGLRWYEWAVWLEGPDTDLNQIKCVRYKLHETFPDPVRTITDRSSNFRLSSSGWGEFMIYADALLQDGSEIPLRHWLRFEKPDAASLSSSPKNAPLTLFLSASAADEALADALQEALEKQGVTVLRPSDNSSLPLTVALQHLMEQASVAIILLSDRYSPWLKAELKAIEERKLPWIPLVVGGEDRVPEILKHAERPQTIQVKAGLPASVVAENIANDILERCQKL